MNEWMDFRSQQHRWFSMDPGSAGSTAACFTPQNASSITTIFNSRSKLTTSRKAFLISFELPLLQSHFFWNLSAWNLSVLSHPSLFSLNVLFQSYWTITSFPWAFWGASSFGLNTLLSVILSFSPNKSYFSFRSPARSFPWSSCSKSEVHAPNLNPPDPRTFLPLIAYLLLHFPH